MVEWWDTQASMMSSDAFRLAICVVVTGAIFSAAAHSRTEEPLWSKEIKREFSNNSGVAFLSNEKLVLYEVDYTSELSSRKSPEISSAYRLHLSLLDAASGKIALTKEWGTRQNETEVQVTSGGVLVKTGSDGMMKLYSPDFLESRDLPVSMDPHGRYFSSVSASGKTILISSYLKEQDRYVSHVDVLDADTLKIRSSWDQRLPFLHFSTSDERFATENNGGVTLTELGNPSENIGVLTTGSLKRNCPAGIAGPNVISDSRIVLRDCMEVLLLDIKGESYTLDAFNGRGSTLTSNAVCKPYNPKLSEKIAVASGGERFVAVTLPALKIKKTMLAEWRTCLDGLEIAVYDLSQKRRIFAVNVAPLPKNDYDFALSPDGSKLAVLNDRTISVYSITTPI